MTELKSLERRQTILERLYQRSPGTLSLVNPTNVIKDYNAREVIKADPYIYRLWQARSAIVRDEPLVRVPKGCFLFFTEYARGIKSPSVIEPDWDFGYEEPWPDGMGHTAIMWSGGAESVFMEATFTYVPLLRIHNFFPNTNIGREFQLGLIGMAFGFNTTMIGCGIMNEARVRRDFEYTQDFLDLWNECLHPAHLQYPVGRLPTKDQIIEFLGHSGFSFVSCETPRDGEECGHCWHCAEKYYSIMALRTRPGNDDLVLQPKMDLAFLRRMQRQNQFNLRQEVDRFAITTDFFRSLERRYGLTAWRTGDPTTPFE